MQWLSRLGYLIQHGAKHSDVFGASIAALSIVLGDCVRSLAQQKDSSPMQLAALQTARTHGPALRFCALHSGTCAE